MYNRTARSISCRVCSVEVQPGTDPCIRRKPVNMEIIELSIGLGRWNDYTLLGSESLFVTKFTQPIMSYFAST